MGQPGGVDGDPHIHTLAARRFFYKKKTHPNKSRTILRYPDDGNWIPEKTTRMGSVNGFLGDIGIFWSRNQIDVKTWIWFMAQVTVSKDWPGDFCFCPKTKRCGKEWWNLFASHLVLNRGWNHTNYISYISMAVCQKNGLYDHNASELSHWMYRRFIYIHLHICPLSVVKQTLRVWVRWICLIFSTTQLIGRRYKDHFGITKMMCMLYAGDIWRRKLKRYLKGDFRHKLAPKQADHKSEKGFLEDTILCFGAWFLLRADMLW